MVPGERLLLACAIDHAYALPLAVMLRSVADNLDPSVGSEVHVVDFSLSSEDRRRIERSLPERIRILWRDPWRSPATVLPTWGRMPLTPYQKLGLEEWLPRQASRALWLDADTLVQTDLARLWRESFDGALALAVRDARVPTVSSRFGIAAFRELALPAEMPYFNTGVMLIDLAGWRREGIAQHALGYLKRYGRQVVFWDQDVLNATLAGRWRMLDARWNRDAVLTRLLEARAGSRRTPGSAAERAWILHYSGSLKPWNFRPDDPSSDRFFEYLDRTAWSGWRPESSPLRALVRRYATSPARRWLYPLESWVTAVVLRCTRSYRSAG